MTIFPLETSDVNEGLLLPVHLYIHVHVHVIGNKNLACNPTLRTIQVCTYKCMYMKPGGRKEEFS